MMNREKLISVSEPGFTFFYIRDGLGNIIKLVDEQGNDVVKYSYDSWGKVTINTISSLHPSARFNPFMYKGIFMMLKQDFIGYPHVTIRLNYVDGFHQIQSNI